MKNEGFAGFTRTHNSENNGSLLTKLKHSNLEEEEDHRHQGFGLCPCILQCCAPVALWIVSVILLSVLGLRGCPGVIRFAN